MVNQLIINTEYFLGCAGSCSGCFLTLNERQSKNNYHDVIEKSLLALLEEVAHTKGKEFLVIGFGRGNNLNLDSKSLSDLGELIAKIEKLYASQKLVFEISTSLIGKIDAQIENARKLLTYSRNIYFNVVVNSEITSGQFWDNLKCFHSRLTQERESWGWSDDTGDILVLNINPRVLPDIEKLEEFSQGIHSPLNISLFPFEGSRIEPEELMKLQVWTQDAIEVFKDKDLNIKNYLSLYAFELDSVAGVVEHVEKTKDSYYFIDKEGLVTHGIPSIMGEVDFPRLLTKYQLTPDVKVGLKAMQRHPVCRSCEYQKECLATGSYLNMLANQQNLSHKLIHIKKSHPGVEKTEAINQNNNEKRDNRCCPSGYYMFFKEFIAS